MNQDKIRALQAFAARIRLETLKEFKTLGFGHVGGAMSIIETLAVLYGGAMNIDPENPRWEGRDWLVVSKGHSGPAVYAALALKGYFPLEELQTLNKPGTRLPSHCDRNKTIGIDMTTGSLGQGMSTAIGAALGNRLDKRANYTYLIIGDGECDEGQIWEGALFAAHFKVDNLIAFVDYNKQQLDGYTKDIMNIGDIAAKFREFGWHTQEINGEAVDEISAAIEKAKKVTGVPHVIVLDTRKGRGCTFAEGVLYNHHMTVSAEQADEAIANVERKLEALLGECRQG
jgi:transketolase